MRRRLGSSGRRMVRAPTATEAGGPSSHRPQFVARLPEPSLLRPELNLPPVAALASEGKRLQKSVGGQQTDDGCLVVGLLAQVASDVHDPSVAREEVWHVGRRVDDVALVHPRATLAIVLQGHVQVRPARVARVVSQPDHLSPLDGFAQSHAEAGDLAVAVDGLVDLAATGALPPPMHPVGPPPAPCPTTLAPHLPSYVARIVVDPVVTVGRPALTPAPLPCVGLLPVYDGDVEICKWPPHAGAVVIISRQPVLVLLEPCRKWVDDVVVPRAGVDDRPSAGPRPDPDQEGGEVLPRGG